MPSDFGRIILLAIKVCAIDVLESISIAKALAYRNQYDLKCVPGSTSLSMLLCRFLHYRPDIERTYVACNDPSDC